MWVMYLTDKNAKHHRLAWFTARNLCLAMTVGFPECESCLPTVRKCHLLVFQADRATQRATEQLRKLVKKSRSFCFRRKYMFSALSEGKLRTAHICRNFYRSKMFDKFYIFKHFQCGVTWSIVGRFERKKYEGRQEKS